MAVSKKDVQNATNKPTGKAASTYATADELEAQTKRGRRRKGEKLTPVSFSIPDQVLSDTRRFAHYRQQSFGSFVSDVLQKYIEANHAELEAFDSVYEQLGKPLPNPTE